MRDLHEVIQENDIGFERRFFAVLYFNVQRISRLWLFRADLPVS
jgi:hypothetical protein